jgi:flagellar biosynthesis protein FliP
MTSRIIQVSAVLVGLTVCLMMCPDRAGAEAINIPNVQISFGDTDEPQQVAKSLQILFLLTVLTLAPSILIMTTSFTRIIIIFSFLRNAMHTQQMPSNQILVGMALFLTFYIMSPVWTKINESALQPYLNEEISLQAALENTAQPVRAFMLHQTREKDLALLVSLTQGERPRNPDDIPLTTIIPAFIVSEVTIAFTAGFIIFIPFLIIDMVVACVLLSMGMMMLPPVMVSLPFKLMLFVLVDGWGLIIGSVVKSFY